MRSLLAYFCSAVLLGAIPVASHAANVEKPEAIDGSTYSIIPSALYAVVTSTGRTDSYIRLFNGGLSSARFDLTIVKPATGVTVGTPFSINIPSHASQQFILGDLLGTQYAKATFSAGSAYIVYLKSSEPTAGYQHIYYNDGSKLFENASACSLLLNQSTLATSNTLVLTNLTTSILASGTLNYPTSVVIHNYSTAAATYRIMGVNAFTGATVGNKDVTIQANQTFSAPFFNGSNATSLANSLQNNFGWTPQSSELWANLFITDTSGAAPQATAIHVINNNTLGGSFAMTTACALNAPVSTSLSATTTTTFDGAIGGANGQTGTFSVTVQASGSSSATPETMQSVKATVEKPQAALTATGTLRIGNTTTTLTGTYDTATRKLVITGGGYTFTGGVISGSTFSGTYTGPGGAAGGFAGDKRSATVASRGYCGTFSGHDDQGPIAGTFNFVASGSGAVSGTIATDDGSSARITGTASATAVSGYTDRHLQYRHARHQHERQRRLHIYRRGQRHGGSFGQLLRTVDNR